MIPAWATPTAWVFVIATGPSNVPDSLIQETPVISPLPFWEWKPAATGSPVSSGPRGWMAVTPVRTKLPSISVTYPTSTPRTSVMAFHRPGRPPNGMPRARARGLPPGVVRCGSGVVMVISVTIRGASSPDVPAGTAPVRHDGGCGPQAAGQCDTRAHHRLSVLPPAGGP